MEDPHPNVGNEGVLNLFVQVVREAAERHYHMVINGDDIIRQAINNIVDEMPQRNADNEPLAPVRAGPREVGQLLNEIIRNIQMIQQPLIQNIVQGPQVEIPNPAPADEGVSVSPSTELISVNPPRGGSRKVKKTKSSNKRPTARRRHRSSKARNARKSRTTRRR